MVKISKNKTKVVINFIKDNKKIIFREIEQIDEESIYYKFKNEQSKIYRMKENEREFLNEIGANIEFDIIGIS